MADFPASLRAERNSLDAPTSPLGAFALFLVCGEPCNGICYLVGSNPQTYTLVSSSSDFMVSYQPAWGIDSDLAGYEKPTCSKVDCTV